MIPKPQEEVIFMLSLAQFSPADYRFAKWKGLSDHYLLCFERFRLFVDYLKVLQIPLSFAGCLSQIDSMEDKLRNCATFLYFQKDVNGLIRLSRSNFCRWRLCPVCSWRKRLTFCFKFFDKIRLLLKSQEYKFLFLTLNIRNCKVDDIRSTIQTLNRAYSNLFYGAGGKYRFTYPASLFWYKGGKSGKEALTWLHGHIKSIEIKRKWLLEESRWSCNVHLHSLLAVPPNYSPDFPFYIDNRKLEWVKAWKAALKKVGFDNGGYNPTAYVKLIRPSTDVDNFKFSDQDDDADRNSLLWAVREVFKYSVKSSDLEVGASYFADKALLEAFPCLDESLLSTFSGFSEALYLSALDYQLRRLRLIESSGCFRGLSVKDSDPDLLHVKQFDRKFDEQNISSEHYFSWRNDVDGDLIFVPDFFHSNSNNVV